MPARRPCRAAAAGCAAPAPGGRRPRTRGRRSPGPGRCSVSLGMPLQRCSSSGARPRRAPRSMALMPPRSPTTFAVLMLVRILRWTSVQARGEPRASRRPSRVTWSRRPRPGRPLRRRLRGRRRPARSSRGPRTAVPRSRISSAASGSSAQQQLDDAQRAQVVVPPWCRSPSGCAACGPGWRLRVAGGEHRRRRARLPAVDAVEPLLALLLRTARRRRRTDRPGRRASLHPHDEVAGQPDAPRPAGRRGVPTSMYTRGEGDGDAGAPVEHVVQEAVARIVVVVRVARGTPSRRRGPRAARPPHRPATASPAAARPPRGPGVEPRARAPPPGRDTPRAR